MTKQIIARANTRLTCSFLLSAVLASACANGGPQQETEELTGKQDFFSAQDITPLDAQKSAAAVAYYKTAQRQAFAGVHGVALDYVVFPATNTPHRGALVVVNGLGESHAHYAEMVYDLRSSGYTIYMYDHRGQGFSERLTVMPHISHVLNFQHYVDDLQRFLTDVVQPAHKNERVVALGHSMGGAVLTTHAIQYPSGFDAIVLSAPMLDLPWAFLAHAVGALMEVFAVGHKPFPFIGDPDPNITLEDAELTSDPNRFAMVSQIYNVEFRAARPRNFVATAEAPGINMGGVTGSWVKEAVNATRYINREAARLTTPTLVLQATADTTVDTDGHAAVCDAAADCRLIPFEGAWHGLLIEHDEFRTPALQSAVQFLSSYDRP